MRQRIREENMTKDTLEIFSRSTTEKKCLYREYSWSENSSTNFLEKMTLGILFIGIDDSSFLQLTYVIDIGLDNKWRKNGIQRNNNRCTWHLSLLFSYQQIINSRAHTHTHTPARIRRGYLDAIQ